MGGPGSGAKPREYPAEIVALAVDMYAAGHTIAEVQGALPAGFKAQRIIERHVPVRRTAAKRDQRGPRNHMWKSTPGYQAAHLRLGDERGSCTDCGEPAQHWSYVGGCAEELTDNSLTYCTHQNHYEPRCVACHQTYDGRNRDASGRYAPNEEVTPHARDADLRFTVLRLLDGGLDMGVQSVLGGEVAWHCEVEDAPSRILAHHWPDVPNLGDIATVDWRAVPRVDVLTGGSPCFAAGTPVLTRRGSVSIEDVVIGDEVWTHRNRWRPVVDVMSRTSELVRLGPITTTPDHPFYSRTHSRVWNNDVRQYRTHLGEPEWTPAADAQRHYLASPLAVIDKEPAAWVCDPWLAGRYVADGWANRKQVMIAVGDGKQEEFGREASQYHWTLSISGPSCTRYTLSSTSIAAWLKENFGHGAAGKTIPTFVLAAREADRQRFLAGYLSGDGSEKPDGHWVANTVSTHLASQLRLLALGLGYTSQVREVATPDTKVIEGRVVNQRNYWSVAIRPNAHRYTFDIDGLHWFCQRKPVNPCGAGTVYDLTVDEDHSFVAWGYVVHNCQDVSTAGKRAGMRAGTRSGLWASMCDAIEILRPQLVVWENVQGVLSSEADSAMEPCPGCVGDGDDGPVLRALGRVLGDLAELGYDTWRCGLRAADVGAPHGRYRVFVFATPADAEDVGHERGRGTRPGRTGPENGGDAPTDAEGYLRRVRDGDGRAPADADSDAVRVESVALAGSSCAPEPGRHGETPPDGEPTAWGPYAPAIDRWAAALGRPAPPPTELGPKGARWLRARFVEWMMGLPAGHVTDVPGISRNDQLKALGNGVVPQQSAEATRRWLAWRAQEVAA